MSDLNRFSVPISRSSYYVVDIGLELYYASYDNADLDRIHPAELRIRIRILIKVMGICHHWSIDPPGSILSLQAFIVCVTALHDSTVFIALKSSKF
jgi:hypothetical protein